MSILVSLTEQRLDVRWVIAAAGETSAGAVASFVGTVRSSSSVATNSADVIALFYEAHLPLAEERLRDIAARAVEGWKLSSVAVVHRLGRCDLGEATVAIACASRHREEAFSSCRWIIEQLKATAPIWKSEIYEEGERWIGMGS